MDFLNLSLQGFKFFMFERAFTLEINDFAVLSRCAVGLLALLIVTLEAKELLVMINSDASTLLLTYALVAHHENIPGSIPFLELWQLSSYTKSLIYT